MDEKESDIGPAFNLPNIIPAIFPLIIIFPHFAFYFLSPVFLEEETRKLGEEIRAK